MTLVQGEFQPPIFFVLDGGPTVSGAATVDVYGAGGEDDLEYYVRECGDILGISSKLAVNKRSAKDVLQYVFQHVVECKKLNQASSVDVCT